MAMFWSNQTCNVKDLPLKLQAQSIRNNGTKPIYVMGVEDDVPIGMGSLMAFSIAIIAPGQELDIANNPFIQASSLSYPDFDVTLHSDDNIDVGVISSDACTRWFSDPKHPWNGALLPNGCRTEKYKFNSPQNQAVGQAIATITANNKGSWPGWATIDITIDGPKCECGKEKHGFANHSSWCELYKKDE